MTKFLDFINGFIQTEGKGIGLYMVKTQVEALGEKINLRSEVSKGTEIIVEFQAA